MNTAIETSPGAVVPSNTRPLWAAVGVLGIAVLAMGAGLIYVQTRTAPAIEVSTAAGAPVLPQAVGAAQSLAADEEVVTAAPAQPAVTKPVVVAKPKPAAVPRAVAPAPAPVVVAAAEPQPPVVVSQPVARPVCGNCGTVEAVTPVQRQGDAKGVGAVAGGVLGAVVGNQIGSGGGRTAATVLGALGGGYAGHTIEKNVRKHTVYQVRVRMDDGSTRTVEQATLPSVGSPVVIDNGVMRSAGASAPAPIPVAAPQPQPAAVQATQVSNRS